MAQSNVSVRIGLVGGQEVEGELVQIGQRGAQAFDKLAASGPRATAAMNQVGAGSRSMAPAVQNAAYQIGDFAVQVAGGTSATRALAQQLPQLLGGFGLFGAVAGAVFAVVAPLVGKLFEASDATADLVDEMMQAGGTAGSVESAIGAVRDVAKEYADAIRASGGASSAAASLVIANSKAEFAARKEVLNVEIELLRIRGAERQSDISALQSQVDAGRAGMMTDIADLSGMRGQSRQAAGLSSQLPPSLAAGFNSVTNAPIADATFARQRDNLLALRKLRAEGLLDDIALQKAEAIVNSEFADLGTAASAAEARSAHKGGGGREKPQDEVKHGLDAMLASLTDFSKQAKDIGKGVGDALVSAFGRAEDAVAQFAMGGKLDMREMVTSMIGDLARLATQHYITGPLAGILAGALGGGGFGKALAGALQSFDGGGFTGWGARSGGLDGKGGFLAMMHPRETVIDGARGGMAPAPVVMNIQTRDAASFRQSRGQVAADMARALSLAARMR